MHSDFNLAIYTKQAYIRLVTCVRSVFAIGARIESNSLITKENFFAFLRGAI